LLLPVLEDDLPPPALEVFGIRKSFGRNKVLRGIDLTLPAGTVTVLMGANGAGKSTLVRVICGYHLADAGEMRIGETPYRPRDAADAIRRGVVTVHQSIDDGVIPDLDVASNLMLDRLVAKDAGLWVRDGQMQRDAGAIAASMGISVDMRKRVADLSVADRQMIAIARAMARTPKVLVLDEPTSSLSASEADRLFAIIDRLRAQGVAILYISHRMSDIRRIADRIICMRDGAVSGLFETAPLDLEAAVTAILGHRMTDVGITAQLGTTPVLELDQITLVAGARPLDLVARDGEVVVLTGLLGSGKSRLAEIMYGLSHPLSGRMRLDGKPYAPSSPREAKSRGVYLSPKDRGVNAVVPDFDIANNMALPFLGAFSRASFLRNRAQRKAVDDMIAQVGVVCQSNRDGIGTLSGGNQQKVMIARWLMQPSRVLLLDEPFQGVDIGARGDIGRHIRATAAGRTTLIFVSEIDEAIEVADRILVMHEGSLVGEHINARIDPGLLVQQVTGRAAG
jgi:simple sugar transport system ATP-binding protein